MSAKADFARFQDMRPHPLERGRLHGQLALDMDAGGVEVQEEIRGGKALGGKTDSDQDRVTVEAQLLPAAGGDALAPQGEGGAEP